MIVREGHVRSEMSIGLKGLIIAGQLSCKDYLVAYADLYLEEGFLSMGMALASIVVIQRESSKFLIRPSFTYNTPSQQMIPPV